LRDARLGNRHPIGILTHHLDHDESAWKFLDALFQATVTDAHWCAADQLIAKA